MIISGKTAMELGSYGVLLTSEGEPFEALEARVRDITASGYTTLWLPECHGREAFATAGALLARDPAITVVGCGLDTSSRTAETLAMAQQTLTELSGGRFVLGLDAGDGNEHGAVVSKSNDDAGRLRVALALLREAHTCISLTRCLALEGDAPQTVETAASGALTTDIGELPLVLTATSTAEQTLAGELAQGIFEPLATPETVAIARTLLGPTPALCALLRVCLVADVRRARALGRHVLAGVFATSRHWRTLVARGWVEDDFAFGGSDRLVDTFLAWGDVEALRTRVDALRAAGATHVVVQALDPENPARPCLRALAALRE
jgi:alkanesulfonate monooxygenase SsuD/methylene tetrahydromethanopterin reductase-like flavin-dependent oxidoreductase (luciferase family)